MIRHEASRVFSYMLSFHGSVLLGVPEDIDEHGKYQYDAVQHLLVIGVHSQKRHEVGEYGEKGGAKEGTTFSADLNIYAIPSNEIATNSNLKQNPGYK